MCCPYLFLSMYCAYLFLSMYWPYLFLSTYCPDLFLSMYCPYLFLSMYCPYLFLSTYCPYLFLSMYFRFRCSLTVQLGRDLRSEFYGLYFERFSEVLIKLIEVEHHNAEVLNDVFMCLAVLFQTLFHLMLKDIRKIFR